MMAEMQPLLGRKGKANSVVRKHFGQQTKIIVEDMTNLFNHLKSTHRVIQDQGVKFSIKDALCVTVPSTALYFATTTDRGSVYFLFFYFIKLILLMYFSLIYLHFSCFSGPEIRNTRVQSSISACSQISE